MSLEAALLTQKVREKAGPRTGSRYTFQAHVSLAKLLTIHKAGQDYRAVFDHFDDLLILNSSSAPDGAWFYQIKGKGSGDWKSSDFCAGKGLAPSTVIGKMYEHSQKFPSWIKEAVFVSNATFSFGLPDGKKTGEDHERISLGDLSAPEKKKFAEAIDKDFAPPRVPAEADLVWFEKTKVPVKAYDLTIKGQLVDFFGENHGASVLPVYRTLIGDITAKANDTTEWPSLEEMFANKSLSRADLDVVLSIAKKLHGVLDNWPVIDDELKASGKTATDRIRAKTGAIEYLRDRSKRSPAARQLSASIKEEIEKEDLSKSCLDLISLSEKIANNVVLGQKLAPKSGVVFSASLVEIFEVMHGE